MNLVIGEIRGANYLIDNKVGKTLQDFLLFNKVEVNYFVVNSERLIENMSVKEVALRMTKDVTFHGNSVVYYILNFRTLKLYGGTVGL